MSTMEKIYTFIWRYWKQHGYGPTQQEIIDNCEVSSKALRLDLSRLVYKEAITYEPNKHRGINIRTQSAMSYQQAS